MTASPDSAGLEPLLLARPLALVLGGAVAIGAAAAWGRSGLYAASVGVGLSIANVLVLHRLAASAARRAVAGEAGGAAAGLQIALGAKTIALLLLISLVVGRAGLPMTPFALGLLVTVFALVAAGLTAAFTGRQRDLERPPSAPMSPDHDRLESDA